jgi:choline dehydrogenase-like flavoprotein
LSVAGWSDLAAVASRHSTVEADVCVIGAGAAGIYLATQLAQRGGRVVLLEAGPANGVDSSSVGFDAVFGLDPYPAATTGRFFGMGGSTTRWGGALIPHTAADLRELDASANAWSHIVNTVREKTPAVLRHLGFAGVPDFESFAERSLGQAATALVNSGFQVQSGLYLPFRRKNLVCLLNHQAVRSDALRVYFNAVAQSWEIRAGTGGAAMLRRLVAVSRNRNELRVTAGKFVICAGAIESARMLLEMQDASPQPVLRETSRPGCYLGDHLSMPIADVVSGCVDQTASLFGPRFSGAWMRSYRLLESEPPSHTPRTFAHFIFSNRSRGFELAKVLLGALQQRRLPRVNLGDMLGGGGDLTRLGYGRFVQSRLYIPAGTPVHLQLDMEQVPVRENRVTLTDQRDDYGRRVARIDWHISPQDIDALAASAQRYLSRWPGAKAGLPELRPRPVACGDDGESAKPYDAYHPVGTCRMGDDAEAVVDETLKVCGLDNLWLVSTGVLPSAGTANPTFTMLCLGQALSERLSHD